MAWRRKNKIEVDISDEKLAEIKDLLDQLEKGHEKLAKQISEIRRATVDLSRAASRAEAAARLPLQKRH